MEDSLDNWTIRRETSDCTRDGQYRPIQLGREIQNNTTRDGQYRPIQLGRAIKNNTTRGWAIQTNTIKDGKYRSIPKPRKLGMDNSNQD